MQAVGRPVAVVTRDGDRALVTLLEPGWAAQCDFARCVLAMPLIRQANLIAAVMELWGCYKVSDMRMSSRQCPSVVCWSLFSHVSHQERLCLRSRGKCGSA